MKNIVTKKDKKPRKSKASQALAIKVTDAGGYSAFAQKNNTSRQNIRNWCIGCEPCMSVKDYFKDKHNIPVHYWNEYI